MSFCIFHVAEVQGPWWQLLTRSHDHFPPAKALKPTLRDAATLRAKRNLAALLIGGGNFHSSVLNLKQKEKESPRAYEVLLWEVINKLSCRVSAAAQFKARFADQGYCLASEKNQKKSTIFERDAANKWKVKVVLSEPTHHTSAGWV